MLVGVPSQVIGAGEACPKGSGRELHADQDCGRQLQVTRTSCLPSSHKKKEPRLVASVLEPRRILLCYLSPFEGTDCNSSSSSRNSGCSSQRTRCTGRQGGSSGSKRSRRSSSGDRSSCSDSSSRHSEGRSTCSDTGSHTWWRCRVDCSSGRTASENCSTALSGSSFVGGRAHWRVGLPQKYTALCRIQVSQTNTPRKLRRTLPGAPRCLLRILLHSHYVGRS